jgi:hypothetical protein
MDDLSMNLSLYIKKANEAMTVGDYQSAKENLIHAAECTLLLAKQSPVAAKRDKHLATYQSLKAMLQQLEMKMGGAAAPKAPVAPQAPKAPVTPVAPPTVGGGTPFVVPSKTQGGMPFVVPSKPGTVTGGGMPFNVPPKPQAPNTPVNPVPTAPVTPNAPVTPPAPPAPEQKKTPAGG